MSNEKLNRVYDSTTEFADHSCGCIVRRDGQILTRCGQHTKRVTRKSKYRKYPKCPPSFNKKQKRLAHVQLQVLKGLVNDARSGLWIEKSKAQGLSNGAYQCALSGAAHERR